MTRFGFLFWRLGLALFIMNIQPVRAVEVIETDLELVAGTGSSQSVYWLDDRYVLASFLENELWTAPDGSKNPVTRIYIWDTETNQLKPYAGPGTNGLCLGDGFIRYYQRRLSEGKYDELDRYYGPVGREQKVLPSGPIDLKTCLLRSEVPEPPWLEAAKKNGRQFNTLKPEHGWLEFFPSDTPHNVLPYYTGRATFPIAIHAPNSDQALTIDQNAFQPWLDQRLNVRLLRYEAFKNAYLLGVDDTSPIDKNQKNGQLWWLHPDGRIENALRFEREGSWKTAFFNTLIPAKTTVLLKGTETHPVDKSGLYILRSGRFELLIRGSPHGGSSLSPDGCKLAIGIDPRGFPNNRYRLYVANLCDSENARKKSTPLFEFLN